MVSVCSTRRSWWWSWRGRGGEGRGGNLAELFYVRSSFIFFLFLSSLLFSLKRDPSAACLLEKTKKNKKIMESATALEGCRVSCTVEGNAEAIEGTVFAYDAQKEVLALMLGDPQTDRPTITVLRTKYVTKVEVVSAPSGNVELPEGVVKGARLPKLESDKLSRKLRDVMQKRQLHEGASVEAQDLFERLQRALSDVQWGDSEDGIKILVGGGVTVEGPNWDDPTVSGDNADVMERVKRVLDNSRA